MTDCNYIRSSCNRESEMYRRILVPLDGSELAETVLPYAKELAERLDVDVIILHVYRQRHGEHEPMHRAYVERASGKVRRQMRSIQPIEGTQPIVAYEQVRGIFTLGRPAEEILRYADNHGIDLILMATHGRSGVQRWAMGSIATKVLRVSKVPVLLVPVGSRQEFINNAGATRTIVVPLDGSELAETVIPYVETLINQWDSNAFNIVLIKVCESPFVTADYPEATMLQTWDQHVDNMKARFKLTSEQYLRQLENKLRDAGLNARSEVLMGKTADMIIEYAKVNPSSMVAMSSHGRSGLKRWAYGSVADKVVHGASCPVLLIRSA